MELNSKLSIASLTILAVITIIQLSAAPSEALQTCGGSCNSNDDCKGQLACISGTCNDDPDVGTHICSGSGSDSSSCTASSYLKGTGHSCNTAHGSDCCVAGKKYAQYHCSPAVTAKTPAILTLNGFGSGEDGGGKSKCDEKFHSDKEKVVALSTGWYNNDKRCGKQIRIKAANGKSVLAKVVDECDSVNGCDSEHDYQPPCPYNDVDASQAVWDALGLNSDIGQVSVTWSDA